MIRRALYLVALVGFASALQAEWKLHWVRTLPKRTPAWKHTPRIRADDMYEPVAAGKLVLVGCSHNDALLAFDLATGREQWRFYTNGPLRVAPVADAGAEKIYVGSEDGYLYCLDIRGRLQWKVRPGPRERRILAHQRLISVWPVSARPVLWRDTVFFVAGYWPIEGIFVRAVDARTGKRLWTNSTAQIRPYGRMRVVDEKLVIDGHRGGAMFDVRTGKIVAGKPPRAAPRPAPIIPPGVEDSVVRSIEAGKHLLVTTLGGKIYCFAAAVAKPRVIQAPAAAGRADTRSARQVLAKTGAQEGYALVLGLEDGALVEGLLRQSKLRIIAIDADAKKVDAVRRRLDAMGLFDAQRLAVHVGETKSLGLPRYLARLIVSETKPPPKADVFESLRPYGGVLAEWIEGRWQITKSRDGPPPGAADWTHEFADAGNSLCAADKLVRAPLGLLWYGGPATDLRYYFNGQVGHDTHGHGVSPLPPNAEVVDGRMILQGPGVLVAVDIYTGRVMWERKIPRMFVFGGKGGGVGIHSKRFGQPWKVPEALKMDIPPIHHSRTSGLNYVSVSDGIYLVAGRRLLRYHPADGRPLSDWPVPIDGDLCWGNIRVAGNHLIATVFQPKDLVDAQAGHDGNGGDWAKDRLRMSHLLVLNRQTGKLLWSRKAAWGFLNRGLAVGRGKVFCVDLIVARVLAKLREAGHRFPKTPPTLYALDVKTGKVAWKYVTDVLVKHLSYSGRRDILVAPCRNLMVWRDGTWHDRSIDARRGKPSKNAPGKMRGFRGTDGTRLWEVDEAPYFEPHILAGDLIIDRYAGTYDLRTGKRHERISPLTGQSETWSFRRGGCNHLIAAEGLVTWRTAYYDLKRHTGVTRLTGFDAGCTPTFLPAGGVVTAGNFGTHYKRSRTTALALIHQPDNDTWAQYATHRPKRGTGPSPIRRAGFNFGAPGDRFAADGVLWLAVTVRKREAVTVTPKSAEWFRIHPTRTGSWVAASGVIGVAEVAVPVVRPAGRKDPRGGGKTRRYDVRLHFAEPESLAPGRRVFSVQIEGKTVLKDLDVAQSAGGPDRPLVRRIEDVAVDGPLDITFTATRGQPLLCGVEIIAK